jgi:hypothetical protein
MKKTTDYSIFALSAPARSLLLASSTKDFLGCEVIRQRQSQLYEPSFEMTNFGLRITLPLVEPRNVRRLMSSQVRGQEEYYGVLNCRNERENLRGIALALKKLDEHGDLEYYVLSSKRRLVGVSSHQMASAAQPTQIIILRGVPERELWLPTEAPPPARIVAVQLFRQNIDDVKVLQLWTAGKNQWSKDGMSLSCDDLDDHSPVMGAMLISWVASHNAP